MSKKYLLESELNPHSTSNQFFEAIRTRVLLKAHDAMRLITSVTVLPSMTVEVDRICQ
jgi:hypothetical protein